MTKTEREDQRESSVVPSSLGRVGRAAGPGFTALGAGVRKSRVGKTVYYDGVKLILCFSILITSCAWADEGADRKAIEQLVVAFNNHSKPPSDLFTADAPDSERIVLSADEGPLSEVTPSKLMLRSVRFITSKVALVECANTQYGSVIMARTTTVLLVIKKDRARWRIASLRVLGLAQPLPGR